MRRVVLAALLALSSIAVVMAASASPSTSETLSAAPVNATGSTVSADAPKPLSAPLAQTAMVPATPEPDHSDPAVSETPQAGDTGTDAPAIIDTSTLCQTDGTIWDCPAGSGDETSMPIDTVVIPQVCGYTYGVETLICEPYNGVPDDGGPTMCVLGWVDRQPMPDCAGTPGDTGDVPPVCGDNATDETQACEPSVDVIGTPPWCDSITGDTPSSCEGSDYTEDDTIVIFPDVAPTP